MAQVRCWLFALAALLGMDASASAAQPVCMDAARLIAARARSVWRHGSENLDVASLFAKGAASKLTFASRWFTASADDRATILKAWNENAPDIALTEDSIAALTKLGPEHLTFYRLAAGRVIAANAIGGTASCNASLFLRVEHGQARVIDNPADWKDDPFRFCDVGRTFATLRGTPVVLDSGSSTSTSTDGFVRLNVLAQQGWLPPCAIDIIFNPGIDQGPLVNDWPKRNDWPANNCDAQTCDRLRKAIVPLVAKARRAPDRALAAALQGLSKDDRDRYNGQLKSIDPRDLPGLQRQLDGEAVATERDLTDVAPLILPLTLDGRLYVVSLGHFTIGWRVFPDWLAKVSEIDGDGVRDIARFAIPAGTASLRSVAIRQNHVP